MSKVKMTSGHVKIHENGPGKDGYSGLVKTKAHVGGCQTEWYDRRERKRKLWQRLRG